MKEKPEHRDHSAAWLDLAACITGITTGPWLFVQLRGDPVTPEQVIDNDDVDLLCNRENIHRLFDKAFDWVKEGLCHIRITSRRMEKIQLTLISIDGRHRAVFDLWIHLWQINHGRNLLRFDICLPLLKDAVGFARLPVDIEACLYIHHLVSKKKDLSKHKTKERLVNYQARCITEKHARIAALIDTIIASGIIAPKVSASALSHIEELIHSKKLWLLRLRRVVSKIRAVLIGPPRRSGLASIMGCDGVGKTTLIRELPSHLDKNVKTITGKHLYRKSILFKLAVIFIRPLLFQSRERFDESLAPLVYIRAAIGLRLKSLLNRSRFCLVDRSIVDFLVLDRKTDNPRFSRFRRLTTVLGFRILNVHCMVDWNTVVQRKQEVTETGYAVYNMKMFRHFSRQTPTDYLLFNNDGGIEDSAAALARCLNG